MATRYQLHINPLVLREDIPALPEQLQTDFNEIFQPRDEFWDNTDSPRLGYLSVPIEKHVVKGCPCYPEKLLPILQTDPHGCEGFPWHKLKGDLSGYRALEVGWFGNHNAYRLVYRVYEKPAPRRVLILSFAEHDPAYEKALARIGKG